MYFTARPWRLAIVIAFCAIADVAAQQAPPDAQAQTAQQQPAAAKEQIVKPPVAPQVPEGFQLNQLQQTALDTVLNAWQQQSATVKTFRCTFQRWEYDVVFGPKDKNKEIPLYKNLG